MKQLHARTSTTLDSLRARVAALEDIIAHYTGQSMLASETTSSELTFQRVRNGEFVK